MAADFEPLKTQIERIKQVRPAIEAVIDGIADKIKAAVDADNAGDNSLLATLESDVRTEADGLVAAALKGTPAEEPPAGGGTGGGTEGGGSSRNR